MILYREYRVRGIYRDESKTPLKPKSVKGETSLQLESLNSSSFAPAVPEGGAAGAGAGEIVVGATAVRRRAAGAGMPRPQFGHAPNRTLHRPEGSPQGGDRRQAGAPKFCRVKF